MVTQWSRAPRVPLGGVVRSPRSATAVFPLKRADALVRVAVMALAPMFVCAQTTTTVVTVDSNLAATDNGALSPSGLERHDLIASIRPKVAIARRGAGLEFNLDAAVNLLGYANGTQRGGVLPEVSASLKGALVERLLFVDAAAQVRSTEVDAFGARADDTTGANRRTQGSYRVSPYIEREFAPHTSLLARHDATLTTNGAGVGARLLSNHTLLRIERKPVPLGAALELSRLDNEASGFTNSRFTQDTARLRGSIGLANEVVLGAVAGTERSRFLLSDHTDALYGLSVQWKPGPRTELSASLEHRFFGIGGELALRHRMPFLSFALTMSRQPIMASESLGVLGQGADIRTFLDGILTTRYPDPVARAELVDNLVTSRGIDTRSTSPIDVVAEYPQLQTAANATLVLLGTRNTASLTLYAQTVRQITRDGDPLASSITATADSRQLGAAFQFNRRLTPQLSAEVVARWSKITGLAARTGDISDAKTYRLSLTQNLSPRTGVSAGVQQNRFTSTVSGKNSYDTTLVFVGMSHRF